MLKGIIGNSNRSVLAVIIGLVLITVVLVALYAGARSRTSQLIAEVNSLKTNYDARIERLENEITANARLIEELKSGMKKPRKEMSGAAGSEKNSGGSSSTAGPTPKPPNETAAAKPDPEKLKAAEFFAVTGVVEHLNMRTAPGKAMDKAGEIPVGAKCVKNLKKSGLVGEELWVKVSYKGALGWVHSDYLRPSVECP